jgi:hypothetical protein
VKGRKVTRVTRKNTYGDSRGSMGLIISTNGNGGGGSQKLGFSVGTIGRVLFPLSATRADRRRLSSAVRSVVAELKK